MLATLIACRQSGTPVSTVASRNEASERAIDEHLPLLDFEVRPRKHADHHACDSLFCSGMVSPSGFEPETL